MLYPDLHYINVDPQSCMKQPATKMYLCISLKKRANLVVVTVGF
jgi:hypothetical protein